MNVTFFTVPERHVTAVFGAVTCTAGTAMVNGTSLTSEAGVSTELTRINAVVVGRAVTVHEMVPVLAAVFCTAGTMVWYVPPPSRESSTFTALSKPRLWFQLIVTCDPSPHVTAVFGVLTVIAGAAVAMRNAASDTSDAVLPPESCATTRMSELAPADNGVQAQFNAAAGSALQPAIGVKVVPLLVETNTSNDEGCPPVPPLADQVTITGTPTKTRSPPFGWTTLTARGVSSTPGVSEKSIPDVVFGAVTTIGVPAAGRQVPGAQLPRWYSSLR